MSGKGFAVVTLGAALSFLPFAAFGQSGGSYGQPRGEREAMKMVPAQAALNQTLNADKVQPGYRFTAKLVKKVQLDNGPLLPAGTELVGRVEQDDMNVQGMGKLALRFTEANLSSGRQMPIKATIVGIVHPESTTFQGYPVEAGEQVPNSWNDGTLRVDQIGVTSGVDLHSAISSRNSGVFVSKTKKDVKLDSGSEVELAIAAAHHRNWQNGNGNMNGNMNGNGGMNGNGNTNGPTQ